MLIDPSPKIGLPESEFVELFNRSKNPIDLKEWVLSDENSMVKLPGIILLPEEYLILTNSTADFTPYGKVWGSADFPSLNNTEDMLTLRSTRRNHC